MSLSRRERIISIGIQTNQPLRVQGVTSFFRTQSVQGIPELF